MASTNITRTEKEQKIDRNYPTADSKDVRNYVLYGNTADNKLYYEAEYTTQVTDVILSNMMAISAVLVKSGGETLVPISIQANKVVTLSGETATPVVWNALATS